MRCTSSSRYFFSSSMVTAGTIIWNAAHASTSACTLQKWKPSTFRSRPGLYFMNAVPRDTPRKAPRLEVMALKEM